MPSLTVDLTGLKKLFKRFEGEEARKLVHDIVADRKIAAIISQAINDNFAKEGPGWAPLKAQTIKSSVSKAVRKRMELRGGRFIDTKNNEPARMILQRKGNLKKSATTPGAQGNIYRVRDTSIEWGTNLHYAGIHNEGGVIKHPGSKNAFGIKGLKTKPHNIVIQARQYLRISEMWMAQINTKVVNDFARGLAKMIGGSR